MLHTSGYMSSLDYLNTQNNIFDFSSSNGRILHFRIKSDWQLHHFLKMHLETLNVDFEKLLELGAIYLNNTRVENFDTPLQNQDYLRIHISPRRFNIYQFDFFQNILFENNDFIIFKKPSGIPCHPTLDNKKENILAQLQLLYQNQLHLCHRLDLGTSGLLLIAKSLTVQNEFQKNWNKVIKQYTAITSGPLIDIGPLMHWMRPHPRAPKILSRSPVENWQTCILHILSHQKLDLLFNKYKIQLETGRTHQIRAQLSFECNPILGDHLYQSPFIDPTNSQVEKFELNCDSLEFTFKNQQYTFNIE